MLSVFEEEQADGLYRKAISMLIDWRKQHYYDFRGVLLFNPADLTIIANEQCIRRARESGDPLPVMPDQKITVRHGDTGTVFGKRCRADLGTPVGCISMELL